MKSKKEVELACYTLGLMSDPIRMPKKIYLEAKKEELRYEVIDRHGKLINAGISWDKLPDYFPRKTLDIIQSTNKFLLFSLLHFTSEAGHTLTNNELFSILTTNTLGRGMPPLMRVPENEQPKFQINLPSKYEKRIVHDDGGEEIFWQIPIEPAEQHDNKKEKQAHGFNKRSSPLFFDEKNKSLEKQRTDNKSGQQSTNQFAGKK